MKDNTARKILDPINSLIGKIIIAETSEKRFAARLIAVNGEELWFEDRTGRQWMNSRSAVKSIVVGKQMDVD
jgi:hypothetical protein